LPATLGSAAGVYLAETLHNRQLGLIITAAVLVALLLLFTKLKEALAKDYHRAPRISGFGLFVLSFVGSLLGGHFGAKLSSHEKARTWVFRILVAVILLELIHLAVQYW
jgi:uncharacterized membrane protein YfcA